MKRYSVRFAAATNAKNHVYALVDNERQTAEGGEVVATIGIQPRDRALLDRILAGLNAGEAVTP